MRNAKSLLAVGLTLIIALAGGGIAWYLSVPHSADEQLKYAEKLDTQVRGDAVTKSFEAVRPGIDKAAAAYEDVEKKFGKGPAAQEAWERLAHLREEVEKSDEKAIEGWDKLASGYTDEARAGGALLEEGRLLHRQAEALKTGKVEAANKKYRDALAKLSEYQKRFPTAAGSGGLGTHGDQVQMEIGRIWQDGLGDPLINAIDAFKRVIKEYPGSECLPEAMFRLGQLFEKIKEVKQALAMYRDLEERFPKSDWTAKALDREGKILAEQLDKQKEAADKFDKLAREHPEAPEAITAGGQAKNARSKDAEKQSDDYAKGRYGGRPVDTLSDKPLPPSALLETFAMQKLDAQNYDLDIRFSPADAKISVTGDVRMINRGDEKKEIFLMLAAGMTVTMVAVDGVETTGQQTGETWKIALPAPLKKDAATKIEFAYHGVFHAPPEKALAPKEELLGPTTTPGGTTAPATAPATKPASGMERFKAYNPQLALGEFGYGLSGAAWYPVTIIGDIFKAHMTFHLPAGYEVVANGQRLENRPGAAGTVLSLAADSSVVFETKRPVFGLYFCYGHYVVEEKTVGKIHYYTYLREADKAKSAGFIETASSILDFYSQRFGEFPYEKMAIIETPLPPFLGGVGPASMMILQDSFVRQHDVPSTLLAHELAHQWFGNLIPINLMDEHYNQWLSEGFATYADALYTEKTDGTEAFVKHMQKYDQLYFHFSLLYPKHKQAIKDCYPGDVLYRPVVYEKGAIVLHALRKVLGDDKFFKLMHEYVDKCQEKPSTVDDFRRLASEVAGQDLSWFFFQWFDQALVAHWVMDNVQETPAAPASSTESTKVSLDITQPDDLVKMPVDITALGEKGQHELIKDVMLDKKEQKVEFSVPFKPVKLVLDEANWVLKRPGADNVWPLEKPVEEK